MSETARGEDIAAYEQHLVEIRPQEFPHIQRIFHLVHIFF